MEKKMEKKSAFQVLVMAVPEKLLTPRTQDDSNNLGTYIKLSDKTGVGIYAFLALGADAYFAKATEQC